jgi:integrase
MANRKVVLLWYCKTPKGWRRFPVVMGRNARIKHGYVLLDGVETRFPEGRYELRLYEGAKPVYKRAGANAADALAARDREVHLLTAKDAGASAGVKIVEEASRVYLRRAATRFEDDAKQRGSLEAAEVNRHVTDEFIEVTGRTFVDEITREDILKFHKALRARGCGERTVSNKHNRLRAFLRYCKIDHTAVMPPSPKYEVTLPDTYSPEEVGKILSAADPYMRLVIELGLMCGLRDQEIMHLEWPDIDWREATLRVTSKPHWGFKIKDSEERDIPIPASLLNHLKAYREANTDSRLVLPTKNGMPNGKLLRTVKRLAKAHGLNCGVCGGCRSGLRECQEWTLHKLRRTYCTTLLQSGLDLRTVQAFMGHADLASTMRYLRPATSKESQSRINAIQWS